MGNTILAAVRVSAATSEVDAFLAAHPSLAPANVWRAGQTDPRGHVHESSGFTIDLGSGARRAPLLDRTLERMEALRAMLDRARASGADVTIDFGLVVGLAAAFTRTASFEPSHLQRLFELGVTVLVSAYPGQE
jgi:hypothetical protein